MKKNDISFDLVRQFYSGGIPPKKLYFKNMNVYCT